MCRPDTAGWSMQMSQAGWRPTTVTACVSSTSVTIAPSRLTTTRARTSSLSPEARGRGSRGLQLVVDALHALDRARDFGRGVGFGLRGHHAEEPRHPVGAFHGEARLRGALVAAQGRAHAPLACEVVHHAHRFGRLLEAFLLHHAVDLVYAFVDG